MSVATSTAIGIAGALGVAGSIGGAAISASGASKAAGAQTNAANYAANLQHQDAQSALDFQKQQLGIQQQNIAPWLQTGAGALSQLASMLGVTPNTSVGGNPGNAPLSAGSASKTIDLTQGADGAFSAGGGRMPLSMLRGGPNSELVRAGNFGATLTNPLRGGSENGVVPTGPGQNVSGVPGAAPSNPGTGGFVAPTAATEQNDPGYKFRLDQGMQALQNSAAARGGLLSGNTAQAVNDYAQNYASNEYSNVYNRAFGLYSDKLNRLASLAGVGQTAAGQANSASQGASGNVANILLGSGQQIGQDIQNAGAATASGYAAGANAFGGAVGGIGGNLTNLLLLSQLTGKH